MHKAIIDRIEEEHVVCILEKGGEVIAPIFLMPDDCGEGDVVYITIIKNLQETATEHVDAKTLLNELLQA